MSGASGGQPLALGAIAPRPGDVRVFAHERRAGVAEVAASGRMRLDALARWAQDVAWADVEDAGLRELTIWLVRRTRIRVRRFPLLDERFTLSTYVTGVGRMWAERRTDAVRAGESQPDVEIASIWVHIDPERLLPSPVHPIEIDTWTGPDTPSVKARLRHPAPPADAGQGGWTFRRSELDIAAHVNNAAYLTPLDDELLTRDAPGGVDLEVEYHTPAQAGPKDWRAAGGMRWLCDPDTGGVHASALLADWPLAARTP